MGTGISYSANPPHEVVTYALWYAVGTIALVVAAVLTAIDYRRRGGDAPAPRVGGTATSDSGDSASAVASETGAGSVSGNIIQHSTVTVIHGTGPQAETQRRDVIDVTPEYLVDLFEGHTDLQASGLTKAFIGKRMSISGRLKNVTPGAAGGFGVLLDRDSEVEGEEEEEEAAASVLMTFPSTAREQLNHLRVGVPLRVVGRIANITRYYVSLEDCELEKN